MYSRKVGWRLRSQLRITDYEGWRSGAEYGLIKEWQFVPNFVRFKADHWRERLR